MMDSIQNTPMHLIRMNHLGDACDSDTNSHSALITPIKSKPNGNNNEFHEMTEMRLAYKQTKI
jgi:hypothetical protein